MLLLDSSARAAKAAPPVVLPIDWKLDRHADKHVLCCQPWLLQQARLLWVVSHATGDRVVARRRALGSGFDSAW